MAGQFDAWERALRAAGLWADFSPAPATRGLKWSEPVEVEGNWLGASIEGTIRATPDAPSALATFSFSSLSIVTIDGETWTRWTASLASGTGSNSTGILPADGDSDGVEQFPCMFRLTPSGGDKETLLGGYLTVMGKA